MKTITKEEALNYIKNNFVSLHCGRIYNWYQYEQDTVCYKSDGCIVIRNNWLYYDKPHITINIHQISNDADILGVWNYFLKNETNGDTKRTIMILACAPLPDELSEFMGFRKYVRKGEHYKDSDIRKMTESDDLTIKELCDDSRTNDNHFGKCESETFYGWFDFNNLQKKELLGIYDNKKLVGLVSARYYEEVGIAQVQDLFVHKDYRRFGFGRRLVRAALSLYSDKEYYYQAAKNNDASKKLALSMGFEFMGAELFALDEE